jgi:membrane associated rhomboid family serine protease
MLEQAFGMLAFSSPQLIEIWRLFTSLFMHASASHLFFNMLGLYFFGKMVEKEAGPKKFLAIYFLSGIAGDLAYGLISADLVVGASGCVFGLMGFAMLTKPKEMINMYVIPLPLGIVAIIFAVVETMLVYFGEVKSGVAHAAHVAGLAVGLLMAFLHNPKKSGKGLLWLILFIIIIIILGPLFGLVMDLGNLFLEAVDFVLGLVLYGLAKLLGIFLW